MRLCFQRGRICFALVMVLCGRRGEGAVNKPDADVASFIASKRKQTENTAREMGVSLPAEVVKMFEAAARADWQSTSNLFNTIAEQYKPEAQNNAAKALAPEIWYPVQEVGGFCGLLAFRDPKFIRLFAEDTFNVIPPGSVYFGGTDPGRFIITALSSSHADGKPCFTITQNQLVATNYLEYLRGMYGSRLKLPDGEMRKQAMDEYFADAQRRWDHDRKFPNEPKLLDPGEQIKVADGRLQATGPVAVMAINGRVAKAFLEDNPDRQFFLEESYAVPWMYPRLTPIGPILRLHPRDLETLNQDTIFDDRRYWSTLTERLIGLRVSDQTTIEQVCAFVQGASASALGDPAFRRDEAARSNFAKLRSAPAGLYAWRAAHASSTSERRRMANEAEFAFKQAYSLHPANPEVVWHYTMFLVAMDRSADAQKFVTAAGKFNPHSATIEGLAKYVQQVIDWKRKAGK